MIYRFIFIIYSWFSVNLCLAVELPILDAHSHYRLADASVVSPEGVIETLEQNNISHIVLVGEPPELALDLYSKWPERIIPLLGLYESYEDKRNWMHDDLLPKKLEKKLLDGNYKGIGEIHIFHQHKNNQNFKKILRLAIDNDLPVLLHGDRFVVKQVFTWYPNLKLIWAHLGEEPNATMLRAMLTNYPNLYIDTSIRDALIVKNNKLLSEWKRLFIKFPDRFMVAIDAFYTPRWQKTGEVTSFIRSWLSELPLEVARKLAYENAKRLYVE